ncbi:MAG TPA: hypothetical protein VLY20_11840 [Nitrospiria bacterium]|nr:hypothetical protein [Nitrospiria bacterium]
MAAGKKVCVKVRTVYASYVGILLIPPMRKRVSDVLNEEDRTFINLTDVQIDGSSEKVPYISINKDMIESIIENPDR